jgi:hypothetical protein
MNREHYEHENVRRIRDVLSRDSEGEEWDSALYAMEGQWSSRGMIREVMLTMSELGVGDNLPYVNRLLEHLTTEDRFEEEFAAVLGQLPKEAELLIDQAITMIVVDADRVVRFAAAVNKEPAETRELAIRAISDIYRPSKPKGFDEACDRLLALIRPA